MDSKVCTSADRLNQLMKENRMRQVDVLRIAEPYCKEFGIKLSKSALSQYVNGSHEPDQSKLFLFGKIFNVSEAWLMGFDVPREKPKTVENVCITEGDTVKRDELQISLARLFKEMREKEGMTISQISKRVYIDARTWARYEDGTSAPTLPELIRIYSELGHDMLPHVLATMYPSTYSEEAMSAKEMREAVTHFFSDVADDNMVRDFYYIAFGNHGSNLKPQLAELAMIDHLPMDYRVAIVKDVITFYRMASMRGELVNPNKCPPDFDTIIYAIKKGLQAAGEHRNSYTTITED